MLNEELYENSDENNYESDGDTDVGNDDHINPDKNNIFLCYQDGITKVT